MRAALVLLLLLCLPVATAHVPSVGGGARAFDGDRSWAFYEELAPGATHAWTFDLAEGERLLVLVAVPLDARWTPGATLVGPRGIVPLERLDRIGLEPATPYAAREVWSLDVPAPASGGYTLLVSGEGGPYALGYGARESFTLAGWIAIPLAAFQIHRWEGQPLALLLAPYALALAASLLFVGRAQVANRALAGLFLGSALGTLVQLVRAILAGADPGAWGWVFAAIAPLLSLAVAAAAWRARSAWALAATGAAGLVVWSGLLVGPALAGALALQRALATESPRTH